MSSDNVSHDAHIARLQRLLDKLELVTKQANDLSRIAGELRQEAGESIRLVKASVSAGKRRPKRAQKRKRS
jgi:hypothetical protein